MNPPTPRDQRSERSSALTDRRHAIRRAIDRQEHKWERVRRYLGMFFIAAAVAVIYVQENRIDRTQQDQRDSRVNVTSLFCAVLDSNAVISDEQTALFQSIIINGTIQSQPFDGLYRSHGFPPYAIRLQQAKALAGQVGALQARVIDCRRLRRAVAANRVLSTGQLVALATGAVTPTGATGATGPAGPTGPVGPKH